LLLSPINSAASDTSAPPAAVIVAADVLPAPSSAQGTLPPQLNESSTRKRDGEVRGSFIFSKALYKCFDKKSNDVNVD
jgi:hypothetical protein